MSVFDFHNFLDSWIQILMLEYSNYNKTYILGEDVSEYWIGIIWEKAMEGKWWIWMELKQIILFNVNNYVYEVL